MDSLAAIHSAPGDWRLLRANWVNIPKQHSTDIPTNVESDGYTIGVKVAFNYSDLPANSEVWELASAFRFASALTGGVSR
jgi:hypothetical protein